MQLGVRSYLKSNILILFSPLIYYNQHLLILDEIKIKDENYAYLNKYLCFRICILSHLDLFLFFSKIVRKRMGFGQQNVRRSASLWFIKVRLNRISRHCERFYLF